MKTIKGPAIFLAQFAGNEAPFDTLDNLGQWAASLGYKGIQVPTDPKLFDLEKAAASKTYCDDIKGRLAEIGVEITELSTHIQGQLVAVHPVYDEMFDGFAPAELRGKPQARQEWAVNQLKCAAKASQHLGLKSHATFSGALAWPFVYPWPQRPAGLVEMAFAELGKGHFDKACRALRPRINEGPRKRAGESRMALEAKMLRGFRRALQLIDRPFLPRLRFAAQFSRCETVEHFVIDGVNRDELALNVG